MCCVNFLLSSSLFLLQQLVLSIGNKFAMAEMLTALAMILCKYNVTLVREDYTWKSKGIGVTLRPVDGLPLIFTKR